MAKKQQSKVQLMIDDRYFVFHLELPVGSPKKILFILLVAAITYLNPDIWNAVQAAIALSK